MPRVTEEHSRARRRQILDAAYSCFARKGFHRTTMQDICAEADLSPGAVYRYLASKEEIIEAMGSESHRRDVEQLKAAKGRAGALGDVVQMAGPLFEWMGRPGVQEQMRLEVEVWAEALRNPKVGAIVARNFEDFRGPLTEIVSRTRGQADEGSGQDPEYLARTIISLYVGLMLQKGLEPDLDIPKYLAAVEALLGGVSRPAQTEGEA